jgi:acyl carrier protein
MSQLASDSQVSIDVVAGVIRTLCKCPDLPPDPSLRLDSIPRLDSICLVKVVTDLEQMLNVEVDLERMDHVQTLADLASCFPLARA